MQRAAIPDTASRLGKGMLFRGGWGMDAHQCHLRAVAHDGCVGRDDQNVFSNPELIVLPQTVLAFLGLPNLTRPIHF